MKDTSSAKEREEYRENMTDETLFLLIIIILIVLIVAGILWFVRARRRLPSDMDMMEGHEFEFFCAELLKKNGFLEVEVTRGSRDYGVDILAQKEGVTYAIQCKCYNTPIGIKAIQEAYAGRDYYDCMVGVVMTNQYFTTPAVEVAKKLKILMWDRGYLDSMLEEES